MHVFLEIPTQKRLSKFSVISNWKKIHERIDLNMCLVSSGSGIFSSPGQSPGRATVLPLASAMALAWALALAKC